MLFIPVSYIAMRWVVWDYMVIVGRLFAVYMQYKTCIDFMHFALLGVVVRSMSLDLWISWVFIHFRFLVVVGRPSVPCHWFLWISLISCSFTFVGWSHDRHPLGGQPRWCGVITGTRWAGNPGLHIAGVGYPGLVWLGFAYNWLCWA